jgi:hypothetical protein
VIDGAEKEKEEDGGRKGRGRRGRVFEVTMLEE